MQADYLGPFSGKMILVLIDSYSKWPEAFIINNADTKVTIEKCRECFARFGLPRVFVTDNGAQFVSDEFSKFMSGNGIKHITSPPFHPATNGLAENAVKSIKIALKKSLMDPANKRTTLETLLNRYLFSYRNTVHALTGFRPSELIFKNKIRTRLDLLSSGEYEKNLKLDKRIQNFKGNREKQLEVGDRVLCRDYRNPNKKSWAEGIIDEVLGDRIYLCKLVNEDLVWKIHLDQSLLDKGNFYKGKESEEIVGSCLENKALVSDSFSKIGQDTVLYEGDIRLPVVLEGNVSNKQILQEKDSEPKLEEEKVLNNKHSNQAENPCPDITINVRPKRIIKPPQRLNL